MLCFGKFPVSNNILDEKRGSIKVFRRTFFPTLSKNSVGESFSLSLYSAIEKVYGQEVGRSIKISFEKFLSHSVEKCLRETFSLSLISGIEKVWKREREREWGGGGVPRFSVEIFLSQSAEKFRRVTLLCCVSENFS